MGTEALNCFVCDGSASGRYFTLATCRTQTSKIRLIEKLGQLVGDKYMVVISEDDIICRGCASMMNTLDRLEKEMNSLRTVVLRYLEKKYELEEDELLKNSLPQQKNFTKFGPKKSTGASDLLARKRRASNMDVDEEWNNGEKKDGGKSNTWLQCDKCKYTTVYNSFMVHHIRKHGDNKKTVATDKIEPVQSGAEEIINQVKNEQESAQTIKNNDAGPLSLIGSEKNGNGCQTTRPLQKEDSVSDESETVEMIAAEINEFTDERVMIPSSTVHSETVADESQSETVRIVQEETQHQVLQVAEGEGSLDASNAICMVDETGSMIVQNMEQGEDGTLYVQVMDNPDSGKQVISLAEDGSVQMVEVMWDEMVSQEGVDDDNIPFSFSK